MEGDVDSLELLLDRELLVGESEGVREPEVEGVREPEREERPPEGVRERVGEWEEEEQGELVGEREFVGVAVEFPLSVAPPGPPKGCGVCETDTLADLV